MDPTQRETILSIGAFAQTLGYAAVGAGYNCPFTIPSVTNQDENVLDVKLTKTSTVFTFDINKIKNRRTVRSNFLNCVFVLYTCKTKTGKQFRNTELFMFDKDKIKTVDVFFGNTI